MVECGLTMRRTFPVTALASHLTFAFATAAPDTWLQIGLDLRPEGLL